MNTTKLPTTAAGLRSMQQEVSTGSGTAPRRHDPDHLTDVAVWIDLAEPAPLHGRQAVQLGGLLDLLGSGVHVVVASDQQPGELEVRPVGPLTPQGGGDRDVSEPVRVPGGQTEFDGAARVIVASINPFVAPLGQSSVFRPSPSRAWVIPFGKAARTDRSRRGASVAAGGD